MGIIFDTTKLTSLITVGKYFLNYCCNLTIFDTTGLTSLITIGNYFLRDCNKNLMVVIKNPSECLYNELSKTNYKINKLYDKPVIHLINDCAI